MKVYYTMAPPSRKDQVIKAIDIMRPAVDRVVVVCNNTGKEIWTDKLLSVLHAHGAETYPRTWTDNFIEARNDALEKCQTEDWIIQSDSDEHFNSLFVADLDFILKTLDEKQVTEAKINAHDLTYPFGWKKGDTLPPELVSNHYKMLIFKKKSETYFQGVGAMKNVHEVLLPISQKLANLDPKYYYIHIKDEQEIWERAARNVVIGGGGNNVGGEPNADNHQLFYNKEWLRLRELMILLNLPDWPAVNDYLKKGKIDSRLKEWLIKNRQKGMDYENEMVDMFRYYFYYLHPTELPANCDVIDEIEPDSLADICAFIEQEYLENLGRHAELEGKAHYARLLFENALTRDQFHEELMRSPEAVKFKQTQKAQTKQKVEEQFNVEIPMVVPQIPITADMIMQILQHSKFFNKYWLPHYEFGRKFQIHSALAWKVETEGKGTDEAPKENYYGYLKTIKKYLPPETFTKMLNIGAGAGDETMVLQEAGYQVAGITIGKDNIELAKKKYNIDLFEMDMHSLPFPRDFFDSIALIHTFEHAYAPLILIGEMYYVLKDGGRIYIAVPNSKNPEMHIIWHVNLMEPWQIIHYFEYWGFKLFYTERPIDSEEQHFSEQFVFEKLPKGHPDFKNWDYLKHVYKLRSEVE